MTRYRKTMAQAMNEGAIQMQIATLKKAYEPMRNKRISLDNANKLSQIFNRFDSNKEMLKQLYKADIPFVSAMATSRLISKHNMKAQELMQIRKEGIETSTDELKQINEHFLSEGVGHISGFRNDKEKANMISLAKQHGLKIDDSGSKLKLSGNMRKILDMQLAAQRNGLKAEEVRLSLDEGKMSQIDQMQKDGKSAAEIAKLMKLDVKTVKSILGEEEKLHEFKKMTVTFKSMADMAKASTDLAKHGFTIDAKGMVMKVDGKGADLNKFATDLKNFYGATIKAESAIVEGTMKGGIVNYSGQSSGEYMKAKKALKDFMSKPQPAKGADDKVMSFMFDDELLDNLYVASQKKMSDVRPMVKKRLKALGIKENSEHPAKEIYESIEAVKNKAKKTGMPYSILKKVYDRGMAAWRGGHRPGATQVQWALARVNSFVTKSSGTWGGADKDLAKQVRGK